MSLHPHCDKYRTARYDAASRCLQSLLAALHMLSCTVIKAFPHCLLAYVGTLRQMPMLCRDCLQYKGCYVLDSCTSQGMCESQGHKTHCGTKGCASQSVMHATLQPVYSPAVNQVSQVRLCSEYGQQHESPWNHAAGLLCSDLAHTLFMFLFF